MKPIETLISPNTHYSILSLADVTSDDLTALMQRLPEWRKKVVMTYRYESLRKESACAFILLQDALPDIDLRFETNEHGKPSLVGHPEIHFNLSHCKHAVACAISDSPVGIDIECRGRYKDDLARYTCSDEELSLIASATDPDLAFTILWTKKESLLKMLGTGITDNIKDILALYTNVVFNTEVFPTYVCTIATISHN